MRRRAVEIDGLDALFELANATGVGPDRRMVVLIVDAANALTEINSRDDLRARARTNPLLARLRVTATRMVDQEPNLAVVVGWHDDFPRNASGWMAGDVVQRYVPNVSLWPDFQRAEAWPVYRRVLEAHGCSVGGDYSGFCRSDLPVGRVLREVAARGPTASGGGSQVPRGSAVSVDGPFLLDVLRGAGLTDPEVLDPLTADPRDRDAVVALCLQDAAIKEGPLLERVRAPAFRPYVEPGGETDGYRALEALYRSVGLRPAHVILSLEKRTLRRFEVDRDPDLAADLARGIHAALSGVAAPAVAAAPVGGYARVDVTLPPQLVPAGAARMVATVFCTLAREVSHELLEAAAEELRTIESAPGGLASRVILFAHGEPGLDHVIAERLLHWAGPPRNLGVATIDVGVRGVGASRPAVLCPFDLTAAHAVQAVYRSRDPRAEADELVRALNTRLRGHFTAVHAKRPPLSVDYFGGGSTQGAAHQVLPHLIVEAHAAVPVEELRRARAGGDGASLPADDLRTVLTGLQRLGVIPKGDGTVRWTYAGDQFLAALRRAAEADPDAAAVGRALAGEYFFDPAAWTGLLAAIAGAYASDFVTVQHGRLSFPSPVPRLRERARTLARDARQLSEEVAAVGEVSEAADLQARADDASAVLAVTPFDGGGGVDLATIGTACELLLEIVLAGRAALARANERRAAVRDGLAVLVRQFAGRPAACDPVATAARSTLLADAKAAGGDPAASIDRLESLTAAVRQADEEARRTARLRGHNEADAASLRDQLAALRGGLEGVAVPSDHRGTAALLERRSATEARLRAAATAIGPAEHPPIPPEQRAAELDGVRSELEACREAIDRLNREAAQLRRPRPIVGSLPPGLARPAAAVTPPVASPGGSNRGIDPPVVTPSSQPPSPLSPPSGPDSATGEPEQRPGATQTEDIVPSTLRDGAAADVFASAGEISIAAAPEAQPEALVVTGDEAAPPEAASEPPGVEHALTFSPEDLGRMYDLWISGRVIRAEVTL